MSIGVRKLSALAALVTLVAAFGCSGDGHKPPCTMEGVSCSPRDVSDAYLMSNEQASGAAFQLQIDPPSVEEVLEKGPDALGLSPVHLAVRATVRRHNRAQRELTRPPSNP